MIDGFVNVAAVNAAMNRLRLRAKMRVMSDLNTTILHRLDQLSDADRNRTSARIQRAIQLTDSDAEGRVGGELVDLVEGKNVREQQLLQGLDLIFQLLNAVVDGIDHGLFSSGVETGVHPTAHETTTHRLSEPSK